MDETKSSEKTALRLIVFILCLSFAGLILGGGYYYAVELPEQKEKALLQPENSAKNMCKNCQFNCKFAPNYYECVEHCDLVC